MQAVALSVTRPASFAREKPGSRAVHSARARVAAARSCPCTCQVSVQNRESRAAYGRQGSPTLRVPRALCPLYPGRRKAFSPSNYGTRTLHIHVIFR